MFTLIQELRQFFETITLCLKECGVIRDIRRVILSQCIFDEYQSRHRSNCIGPAYIELCHMMLRPTFAQLYMAQIGREAIELSASAIRHELGSPSLITKLATDFILENGLLTADQVVINHPSEGLSIIVPVMCTSLLLEYIDRNKLFDVNQKSWFQVDDKLMALMGGNYPEKTLKIIDGVKHLEIYAIPHIINKYFVAGRPRFMTAEIQTSLDKLAQYADVLRDKRMANREHSGKPT